MPNIQVTTIVNATPQKLWAYLEDISSHVEWMADAESITFTSDKTSGVGTSFDCLTKVGPIKLTDKMTVTEWTQDPAGGNYRMGVRHSGVVSGSGVFVVSPLGEQSANFEWNESLEFPWFLGGPLGALVGKPVLIFIWKRNLKRLAAHFS